MLFDEDREEDLYVRIGAMDIRSFGRDYAKNADLAKSSVDCGGGPLRYSAKVRFKRACACS